MTILRKAEYAALASMQVSGRVIDLGGGKHSEYRTILKGAEAAVVANKDPSAAPDIVCDFEEPLPIPDASFDTALLMNVLEHVFEYRQLLAECARILRPTGTIVLTAPFLFPYHASPEDFYRFTQTALSRSLAGAGFKDIQIKPLVPGVFSARLSLLDRLLPAPLRSVVAFFAPVTALADRLFTKLARATGKRYDPADYAVGFFVTATKP